MRAADVDRKDIHAVIFAKERRQRAPIAPIPVTLSVTCAGLPW
jgi:hypothetical protein